MKLIHINHNIIIKDHITFIEKYIYKDSNSLDLGVRIGQYKSDAVIINMGSSDRYKILISAAKKKYNKEEYLIFLNKLWDRFYKELLRKLNISYEKIII